MMKTYRIYPLDFDSKITGPGTDLTYLDDIGALEAARGMFNLMEIWESTRLVHRADFDSTNSATSAVRSAAGAIQQVTN